MKIGSKEILAVTSLALACGGVPAVEEKDEAADSGGEAAGVDCNCEDGATALLTTDAVEDVRRQLWRVIEFYEAQCERIADRKAENVRLVLSSDVVFALPNMTIADARADARGKCLKANHVDALHDLRSRFPRPFSGGERGK